MLTKSNSKNKCFTKNYNALNSLELARSAHERYLIKQQNEDLELAIEHYLETVKLDPKIPEAYYRLAFLMWESGQITENEAIEQCKEAVNTSPENFNARIYSGYFLQMVQNYKQAEIEFKQAIKLSKRKSGRPRLLLALSILKRINTRNATFVDYLKFTHYFSTGSLMFFGDMPNLKMCYKSFSDEFSVFLYRSLGNLLETCRIFPLALNIYEKATKSTGHLEIFYHKMADLSLKTGNAEIASECYKKSLKANPTNREVLLKLATLTEAFFPEKIDEAIDYYNALLEFEEDIAPIYYQLGHLYLKKNDKLHSIVAFKLALEQDVTNAFYHNSLAFAYLKAEMYDDAVIHYQNAISINPENEWTAIVCHALGSTYAEIYGNVEAAISMLNEGLMLDPKNIDIGITLGDTYMAYDDLDNAIRSYCNVISTEPEDYRAYSKMGLALWEKNFVEEAVVSFHKAIELNPEFDIAPNNLGVIYLDGLDSPEEALPLFEKAIELNPSYTLAYFNAGRTKEALGENEEAAKYYQMALDLNKITEDLDEKEILEKLHDLFDL